MFHYLQYILKSTNAHGVHSPFVYSMITECIYLKKTMFLPLKTMFVHKKYELLQQRLLNYFSPLKVLNLSGLVLDLEKAEISTEITSDSMFDMVCINMDQLEEIGITKILACTHKNSMLMLSKNQTSQHQSLWKELQESSQVTVTIDLYAMGLVFFRKEQVKQDFIIRF